MKLKLIVLRTLVTCFSIVGMFRFAQGGDWMDLWPGEAPGFQVTKSPEKNVSKEGEGLVAGESVIRLANVQKPAIEVFLAPAETRNGTAVVVCPGGGFNILAWDLEGTEVAKWLNSLGVSAAVLKYRVPIDTKEKRWEAPAQDAQRAMRLVRANAEKWGLKKDQIGILGFSAGGCTAIRAALHQEPVLYSNIDSVDDQSAKADFAVLIYPAYLVDDEKKLLADLPLAANSPPMFVVYTFDDPVRPENSLELLAAMKRLGIASELHLFDAGGHGYGLRKTDVPVTIWPTLCELWLKKHGWLK